MGVRKQLILLLSSFLVASLFLGCGDDLFGGGSDGGGNDTTITFEPADQTVAPGTTATFTVEVSGDNLIYQWFKDGEAISNATSSSYTTPVLTMDDNGSMYHCIITEGNGTFLTSDEALLTVTDEAPVITAHPSNVTVSNGRSATFSVEATGNFLTYQWFKDNQPIPDATSDSYIHTAATTDNGAVFHCVVSNSLSSAESNSATLIVISSIADDETIDGDLQAGGEDWYSFDAVEGISYIIETSGELDLFLELYQVGSSSLIEIEYNDDGGENRNAQIEWTCYATDTYYFKVRAYDYDTFYYGPYQVSLTPVAGSAKRAKSNSFSEIIAKHHALLAKR